MLPLLLKLRNIERNLQTRALILTPTRELANQICSVIKSVAPDVHPTCVIGGVSFNAQRQSLEEDARIVVGTPGRVLDLIRQRTILLRHCSYFVVDEADEMFSMDFAEDVQAILARIPDERQGAFVSATITPRVESLANNFLEKPVRIVIDTPGEQLPAIDHLFYNVGGGVTDKAQALCDIIETTRPRSAIIFCNTKSAGKNQSVKIFCFVARKRFYISAGNTGGFHQNIPFLRHFFSGEMIHHMMLLHVRRKAFIVGSLPCDRIQGHDGFMDLGTVVNTTTCQYNSELFHDSLIGLGFRTDCYYCKDTLPFTFSSNFSWNFTESYTES